MRCLALLGLIGLTACEREPSFVGPWDLVHVERGDDVVQDAGFFDFTGESLVVVFVAYAHDEAGFEPLEQPIYTVDSTNVAAVDIETFYNEREPIEKVEIGAFGAFDIVSYTGIRTVFEGDVRWPGSEAVEPTRIVLRR